MRLALVLCAVMAATPVLADPAKDAARWWTHVETLAGPEFDGRLTGTEGHAKAAAYAAAQFNAAGLKPAGTDGYLQPVSFSVQRVDAAASSVVLVADGKETALAVGPDLNLGNRIPQLASVDAPLVFIGYGLHLPEIGVDDFAGQDLKGKIAVYINGGPAEIPAALKSHSRGTQTWRAAEAAGAIGVLSLSSPKTQETPWARSIDAAAQPGMFPADPAMRDVRTPKFSAAFNPANSAKLFAASGHDFAGILARVDAGQAIQGFDLKTSLKARVVASLSQVTSQNVVAKLPGSDPKLAAEHVVVTAHIDHLGPNLTGTGPAYYAGVLDNAAGVSSVLEIARQMARDKPRPKRSVLFVLVTAEEKGLLGSKYFAERPTVPRESIVADLNMDMVLPLWPLKSVIVLGEGESSLGAAARAAAAQQGLTLVADPFPDRNAFTRSDQYSFIRAGIPALAFKFGFTPDSPEAAIERAWRSARYHGLADDLTQPVEKVEAVKFNAYMAAVVRAAADAPQRPAWNNDSFFNRFAR